MKVEQSFVTWAWRLMLTSLIGVSIYANRVTIDAAIAKAVREAEVHNETKFVTGKTFDEWRESHKDWSQQVLVNLNSRMSGIEKICSESHDMLMRMKGRD